MTRLPVELEIRDCANGETVECFLVVAERPVYGPAGVGAFLHKPSPEQALRAALEVATKEQS